MQGRTQLSLYTGVAGRIPTAHNIPPTQPSARQDALYPERGPFNSLYLSLGEWPRLPSTARIGRAQFHRARSASKEGTWPLPPHPSQAARCASTGIVPATPPPFSASCYTFEPEPVCIATPAPVDLPRIPMTKGHRSKALDIVCPCCSSTCRRNPR